MASLNSRAVIDLDKHFEKPVPHRFLHGYLKDEPETCFILLLPDLGFWKGRLFQFLEGAMGGNEYIGPQDIGYSVMQKYGAAFVKSNHGHLAEDLSKVGYEKLENVAHLSNYKTLLCAREIVKEAYERFPEYTYVLGGSGGGLRATILMEKYPETYDGGLAFVQGEFSIIFYYWSLLSKYIPILMPQLNEILDATDVGGSGDPYMVLNTKEQRDGLHKLYNAGFPEGGELQINKNYLALIMSLAVLFQELLKLSPEQVYYQDFWRKKGYAGYDGEVDDQIVEDIEGEVLKVHTLEEIHSHPTARVDTRKSQILTISPIDNRGTPLYPPELLKKPIKFTGTQEFDSRELCGYTINFKSGKLSGKSFHISNNSGNIIQISGVAGGYPEGIEVGDKYVLDNRDFLAIKHYHRHIIKLVEDTYRPPDFLTNGKPIYPQRPKKVKEILKLKHFQTGDFKGKLISIFATQDIVVWPPIFFDYLEKVKKQKGTSLNDCYRYYLVENATHGPPMCVEDSFVIISYYPMIGRALDYLIDWVEKDVAPPCSTVAELSSDYSLIMPNTADERKGIQPVITGVTADGQSGSVKVPLGETVKFNGVAEAPVGKIIKYEWYCQNLKDFYREVYLEKPKCRINTPHTFSFQQPGTYFAVLRVTGDLGTDPNFIGGGQCNLSRIRVTVE